MEQVFDMGLLKICVPSKGRADLFRKTTFDILNGSRIPWSVYVEPQDYKRYIKLIPEKFVECMEENNQGLGYSLDFMRRNNPHFEFLWKLDDDVKHLNRTPRVESREAERDMLERVYAIVETLNSIKTFAGLTFPCKLFHTEWDLGRWINRLAGMTYVVRREDWFTPTDYFGYHEEFFTSGHIFLQEKFTLHCGEICWDADQSRAEGGLQSWDRQKGQTEAWKRIQEELPVYASLTYLRDSKHPAGGTLGVTDRRRFNATVADKFPFSKSHSQEVRNDVYEALLRLGTDFSDS